MGCCLVALASWLSPRLALFLMWLFSDRLDVAFESFLLGFAGFVIVPWTTLFYALAYAPVAGVEGIGWVFVAFGLLLDVSSWSGGGRQGRRYQEERRRQA